MHRIDVRRITPLLYIGTWTLMILLWELSDCSVTVAGGKCNAKVPPQSAVVIYNGSKL